MLQRKFDPGRRFSSGRASQVHKIVQDRFPLLARAYILMDKKCIIIAAAGRSSSSIQAAKRFADAAKA